ATVTRLRVGNGKSSRVQTCPHAKPVTSSWIGLWNRSGLVSARSTYASPRTLRRCASPRSKFDLSMTDLRWLERRAGQWISQPPPRSSFRQEPDGKPRECGNENQATQKRQHVANDGPHAFV